MSANSSSVRAAPEPKKRAHISTHGLPGCKANSRMPATTIPTRPNTEWWMCSPPAVTMLPTPSLEFPLARVTRVLSRARTNVRMKPTSRKNSGRLASSSTCPGSVAKRESITPLLSAQRAVRYHPGRRDGAEPRAECRLARPSARQMDGPADAEELGEDDGLGDGRPSGSQSFSMSLSTALARRCWPSTVKCTPSASRQSATLSPFESTKRPQASTYSAPGCCAAAFWMILLMSFMRELRHASPCLLYTSDAADE